MGMAVGIAYSVKALYFVDTVGLILWKFCQHPRVRQNPSALPPDSLKNVMSLLTIK